MQAALESGIVQEDWSNAARQANNLSELFLSSGDLPLALESARQSVEFADRSQDAFLRQSNRSSLADTLHYAGQMSEIEELFREI